MTRWCRLCRRYRPLRWFDQPRLHVCSHCREAVTRVLLGGQLRARSATRVAMVVPIGPSMAADTDPALAYRDAAYAELRQMLVHPS